MLTLTVTDPQLHNHHTVVKPMLYDPDENDVKGCSFQTERRPLVPAEGRRKRVSFSVEAMVCPFLHRNDYTSHEAKDCWYTSAEFLKFRQDNYQVIARVEASTEGESCIDQDLCTRGLEKKMNTQQAIKQKQSMNAARQYILRQRSNPYGYNQSRSWETAVDDYTLASTYRTLSYKNKMFAYMKGVQDAKEARRFSSLECHHDQGVSSHVSTAA